MLRRLLRTLQALGSRASWERDLDDELRSHLEHRAADLVRVDGLSPREARRRARLELGFRETYKEQCRRSYGLRWFDEMRQDLRYAARTLRRTPALTAVAVVSLALGLGANTVVFGVLNAIVFKPLPVASPELLYMIERAKIVNHSFPNYRDLRDRNTTLRDLVGYRVAPMGLEISGAPRRVWGYLVTGNYFDSLGVRPALGRFFHPEEDRQPNANPVAVLSYACWRNRFGGDPEIAGKTVRINRLPFTITGVAPRGFDGTELFYQTEVWAPLSMEEQIEGFAWLEHRGNSNLWVFGRLRPGVSPQQATADLNGLAADLARAYPRFNEGMRIKLTRLGLYGEGIRTPVEAFLFAVLALAGMVLLAACANVASLLAARASDRYFELAIRMSIGAGRARILRQLMTESMLLALVGGAAGWALATFLLRLLGQLRAPMDLPLQFEVVPDARVFLFALALCVVAGLLFGSAPARQTLRADPNQALRGLARGGAAARRWSFRDLLLAGQVALCCLLVTASFVSVRGLVGAFRVPLGFRSEGTYVAGFDLGLAHYPVESGRALQRRALEAMAAHPGVTAAAYANSIPLSIDQSTTQVFREDTADFRVTNAIQAYYYDVSPGFFRAAGARLIAGREFTWHDDAHSPPVAIVNETLARKLLGTANAVGRRFRYGSNDAAEIVGVVEDGKYETLTEEPHAAVFRAAGQSYNSTTVLIVRSDLPQAEVAPEMRRAISTLDPQLPTYAAGGMAAMQGLAFFPAKAATVALGAFGVLAVMLAITGIYGLASYAVSRRIREIGIRVAVGARPCDVLRSVLGRTGVLLSAGSLAGLLLGMASAKLLSSIVYQATPRDPLVWGAVVLTMSLVGLSAAWLPARRAISVDPIRSLRHE